MGCPHTKFVRKTLHMAQELTVLADQAEGETHEDGWAVLVGVIRDCAYKIRSQAEREMHSRKARGAWDAKGAEEAG